MKPTLAPKSLHLIPEGTRTITLGHDQPGVDPLIAYYTPGGKVITHWTPDDMEIELLKQGVPLVIVIWHGKLEGNFRPMFVGVGNFDLR